MLSRMRLPVGIIGGHRHRPLSLINYVAGVQNIANAANIKTYYSLGSEEIGVINRNGTAHLIIDVMGYYHEMPE